MQKSVAYLVALLFAVGSVNALAAKHMGAEKDAKKPSAEECKKDPKKKDAMKKEEMKKEEKK
jgi:hypothetical protein